MFDACLRSLQDLVQRFFLSLYYSRISPSCYILIVFVSGAYSINTMMNRSRRIQVRNLQWGVSLGVALVLSDTVCVLFHETRDVLHELRYILFFFSFFPPIMM